MIYLARVWNFNVTLVPQRDSVPMTAHRNVFFWVAQFSKPRCLQIAFSSLLLVDTAKPEEESFSIDKSLWITLNQVPYLGTLLLFSSLINFSFQVKILRMRDHPVYEKQLNNSAPEVLRFKWMNDTVPIVTGCICMRKYLKDVPAGDPQD